MEQADELIQDIRKGLLQWYDFKKNETVLYIVSKEEKNLGEDKFPVAEMLREKGLCLFSATCEETCQEEWRRQCLKNFPEGYDYIVSIEALERETQPVRILSQWRLLLKQDGKLFLGMNNRMGIRYFCGDRDLYTERNFDGIEGYRRTYVKAEDIFRGRCYSRAELKKILQKAGWNHHRFYSVYPDLDNLGQLCAEDYLPNEELMTRISPVYHYPETIFMEEKYLYDSLADNGMFHSMANAYLIECVRNNVFSDVEHVTCSTERGKNAALFTVIHKSGIVEKRTIYLEAQERLERLCMNAQELARHNVSVVDMRMENGVCIMPYMKEEVGQVYLKKLFLEDQEEFLRKMDHFRELILRSSEIVEPDKGDGEGAILRRGYLDMIPLNSFYKDGTFVFYDQEFCEEYYPANAIITRMVVTFYEGNPQFHKVLPIEELYKRYGLKKKLSDWRKMEWEFLIKLRNVKELHNYHKTCWPNTNVVNANRQRMNFSATTYQRLFEDIFYHADTRKLILFGAGQFAKKFVDLYKCYYEIYAIVDNEEAKWGQELAGIPVQSPQLLEQMQSGEYKVIICIKNYLSVMKQLDAIGVTEYSIYDAGKDYPRKRTEAIPVKKTEKEERKKYHIGYISGVFDLFHIGHLNMFKRAKEQCEYLIVGVVSDEGVCRFKKVKPFISFEERIEMVRSCRYVDEAVEIPLDYRGPRDAFRLHRFDCQFCGSDYMENPNWLADKEFLEKHGAELVFFPYTETTSSTKIKQLINERLL